MKKNILVTGGNRGIGLAICKQLAENGHTVILGARDFSKGEKAAYSISGEVIPKELNVTSEENIQQLATDLKESYGRMDVLINNAGIMSSSSRTIDAELNEVKKVMETNFYGAWRLSQVLIPLLLKSSDGRIINISSGMGALDELSGRHAGYRISKIAMNGLTILMANELKGKIKVNAMCPGWVETDMGGKGAPRSVEKGAETAVWLALEDKIPTGKFFRDKKIIDW